MAAVFISYRRNDAGGHAGRLHDRLLHWFDAKDLFYDRETIVPGQDFPERLRAAVQAARVVLVLIGPGWIDELIRRALLPEVDFVRSEVALALRRHAGTEPPIVIPILLGGAELPSGSVLDSRLQAELGALWTLDRHVFADDKNADWNNQFVRLRELIAAVPGMPPSHWRPSQGTPQPFDVIEHRLSPHFQDPNGLLGQLHRALEESSRAAVISPAAVYGMGGVGKTQLALRYSHRFRDRYAGVWWLRAETPEGLQLDAKACCAAAGAPIRDQVTPSQALKIWLRGQTAPWLLVYDNAEDLESLREHLPDAGPHHVLVTSRNPAWNSLATPVQANAWSAAQGASFLTERLSGMPAPAASPADLEALSQELGGLPLALEQAAGYLEKTSMAPAEYAALIREASQGVVLLDAGRAATGYERSVIATLALAFERLSDPAKQLLRLLAYFAPEPVAERLFRGGSKQLAASRPELAAVTTNLLAWSDLVAELRRYGLTERVAVAGLNVATETSASVRPIEQALVVHRLTQMAARYKVCDTAADANVVLGLLYDAIPQDGEQPEHWPLYAHCLPHVIQINPEAQVSSFESGRYARLLDRLANYLRLGPALFERAVSLHERALGVCKRVLGEEHPGTLTSMNNLASTLWKQGDLVGASKLQNYVLEVRNRVLGKGHPSTLKSMNDVALTLQKQGDFAGARILQEQALESCSRVLGDNHPDTLTLMNNLANTLLDQRELDDACKLQKQVLEVRSRVLGPEHPHTLRSMNNLASTLRGQLDLVGARKLEERVLDVRCRVLGEDHPDTLTSMSNLAYTLHGLGELSAAEVLMDRAVVARTTKLGAQHPDTVGAASTLATWRALARPAANLGALPSRHTSEN